MCLFFQAREEVFHAQLVAMNTQSGPGSQSSDLLDDSELMTDDRELDADLVGKQLTSKLLLYVDCDIKITPQFFKNYFINYFRKFTYKKKLFNLKNIFIS